MSLFLKKEKHGALFLVDSLITEDGKEEKKILAFDKIELKNGNFFDLGKEEFMPLIIIEMEAGNKKIRLNLINAGENPWQLLFQYFSTQSNWRGLEVAYKDKIMEYFKGTNFVNDMNKLKLIKRNNLTNCYGAFLIKEGIKVISANHEFITENLGEDYDCIEEERGIWKCELNEEIIKKWLKIIKQLPNNIEAKRTFYQLLTWSLCAPLRCVMFDLGCRLMPYPLLKGPKGECKTFYLTILVLSIHNIKEAKNEQYFGGTGIRLKPILYGSTRPQVIDEISDISSRKIFPIITIMKSGAVNKNGGTLPRGRKNLEISKYKFSRPIPMGTNKLAYDDPAFLDRMLLIDVPHGHRQKHEQLTTEEIEFLEDNGKMIGKALLSIYEELDVKAIKEIIERNRKDCINPRIGDKKSFIEVGLLILKKLYEKFSIEYDREMDVALEIEESMQNIVNIKNEEVLSAFFYTIRELKPNFMNPAIYFLKERDNNPNYVIPNATLEEFTKYGIYFKKTENSIVISGKAYKSMINNRLRDTKISDMKDLSDSLREVGIENIYYDNRNQNNKFVLVMLPNNKSKQITQAIEIHYSDLQ